MTPHDRWLEPDEDDMPDDCELTREQLAQKQFDDFDPDDRDYGEML